MNYQIFWFVAIFLFLFLEIGHPSLIYFLSFSIGATVACIVSVYNASVVLQSSVFLISTLLSLCIIHIVLKKYNRKINTPSHRSNIDALIGAPAMVILLNNNWYVKIQGQLWPVRLKESQKLVVGQEVIILQVQGCHVVVRNHVN